MSKSNVFGKRSALDNGKGRLNVISKKPMLTIKKEELSSKRNIPLIISKRYEKSKDQSAFYNFDRDMGCSSYYEFEIDLDSSGNYIRKLYNEWLSNPYDLHKRFCESLGIDDNMVILSKGSYFGGIELIDYSGATLDRPETKKSTIQFFKNVSEMRMVRGLKRDLNKKSFPKYKTQTYEELERARETLLKEFFKKSVKKYNEDNILLKPEIDGIEIERMVIEDIIRPDIKDVPENLLFIRKNYEEYFSGANRKHLINIFMYQLENMDFCRQELGVVLKDNEISRMNVIGSNMSLYYYADNYMASKTVYPDLTIQEFFDVANLDDKVRASFRTVIVLPKKIDKEKADNQGLIETVKNVDPAPSIDVPRISMNLLEAFFEIEEGENKGYDNLEDIIVFDKEKEDDYKASGFENYKKSARKKKILEYEVIEVNKENVFIDIIDNVSELFYEKFSDIKDKIRFSSLIVYFLVRSCVEKIESDKAKFTRTLDEIAGRTQKDIDIYRDYSTYLNSRFSEMSLDEATYFKQDFQISPVGEKDVVIAILIKCFGKSSVSILDDGVKVTLPIMLRDQIGQNSLIYPNEDRNVDTFIDFLKKFLVIGTDMGNKMSKLCDKYIDKYLDFISIAGERKLPQGASIIECVSRLYVRENGDKKSRLKDIDDETDERLKESIDKFLDYLDTNIYGNDILRPLGLFKLRKSKYSLGEGEIDLLPESDYYYVKQEAIVKDGEVSVETRLANEEEIKVILHVTSNKQLQSFFDYNLVVFSDFVTKLMEKEKNVVIYSGEFIYNLQGYNCEMGEEKHSELNQGQVSIFDIKSQDIMGNALSLHISKMVMQNYFYPEEYKNFLIAYKKWLEGSNKSIIEEIGYDVTTAEMNDDGSIIYHMVDKMSEYLKKYPQLKRRVAKNKLLASSNLEEYTSILKNFIYEGMLVGNDSNLFDDYFDDGYGYEEEKIKYDGNFVREFRREEILFLTRFLSTLDEKNLEKFFRCYDYHLRTQMGFIMSDKIIFDSRIYYKCALLLLDDKTEKEEDELMSRVIEICNTTPPIMRIKGESIDIAKANRTVSCSSHINRAKGNLVRCYNAV